MPKALPGGSLADTRHIAAAAVGGMDMIISLNFSHIVKERTRALTAYEPSLHFPANGQSVA